MSPNMFKSFGYFVYAFILLEEIQDFVDITPVFPSGGSTCRDSYRIPDVMQDFIHSPPEFIVAVIDHFLFAKRRNQPSR